MTAIFHTSPKAPSLVPPLRLAAFIGFSLFYILPLGQLPFMVCEFGGAGSGVAP
jgi:hypothetical protein